MSEPLNILVCDDSKVSRIMSVGLLKKLAPGCAIQEAANADEAQAILSSGGVNLLVLDHNMPGRSGLDLAEELHVSRPGLRIALLTANVQDATQQRAANTGVQFFRKPITESVIAAILKQVAGADGGAPA
jgi:CheY-like chemotaxis protein